MSRDLVDELRGATEWEFVNHGALLCDRAANEIERLRALLTVPRESVGVRLVPIEPTMEMIEAAEQVKMYESNTIWNIWTAMLNAV